MSLDELARTATEQLYASATRGLDPADMQARLHRGRRRRAGAWTATAALLVALLAGLLAATPWNRPPVPADRGGQLQVENVAACRQPAVTCLGNRRIRVATDIPVTVTVPSTFALQVFVVPQGLELYRRDVDRAGVTVIENARPVRYDGSWRRDPAAGRTAASMAHWLAGRPFLQGTRVTSRRVGGRTAWHVTGTFRPGAALPASKNLSDVAPTFARGAFTSGVTPDLPGTFTLVDQPRGGVTVIWSWTYGGDRSLLPGNRVMVQALLRG